MILVIKDTVREVKSEKGSVQVYRILMRDRDHIA